MPSCHALLLAITAGVIQRFVALLFYENFNSAEFTVKCIVELKK